MTLLVFALTLLLWDTLALTIYAFFPAAARILLQRAGIKKADQPGFTLFAGSLLFGVGVGMLCALSERMAQTKEVAAAVAGWVAQDISVYYASQATFYRRNPRALRAALLGWVTRLLNFQKKKK